MYSHWALQGSLYVDPFRFSSPGTYGFTVKAFESLNVQRCHHVKFKQKIQNLLNSNSNYTKAFKNSITAIQTLSSPVREWQSHTNGDNNELRRKPCLSRAVWTLFAKAGHQEAEPSATNSERNMPENWGCNRRSQNWKFMRVKHHAVIRDMVKHKPEVARSRHQKQCISRMTEFWRNGKIKSKEQEV